MWKKLNGNAIIFLELKLHIQSSLNWSKTDLGHLVFSQVGKQIKSIESGWSSCMKQLGRELDEHLLSFCEAKAGLRKRGSISLSQCPPWGWWGCPPSHSSEISQADSTTNPLSNTPREKSSSTQTQGDPFSPVETQNEMVVLVFPRM